MREQGRLAAVRCHPRASTNLGCAVGRAAGMLACPLRWFVRTLHAASPQHRTKHGGAPVPKVDHWRGREAPADAAAGPPLRAPRELYAVQTGAALLAGCTSATLTNPLDVIKTRLQARVACSSAHISGAGRTRSGPGARAWGLPGMARSQRWMS